MPLRSPETPALDSKTSRLLDEAIDLVIRRQGAPDNPVTLQTIAVWRARSAEHDRIWLRVAEAHGLSGLALAPAVAPRPVSRRGVMLGGLAALGLAGLGAWQGPRLRLRLLADHLTTTAEMLPIELADGSRAILGPDSALVVAPSDRPREVRLLQGMAWFEVKPDARQPFVLRLGEGIEARTAEAEFEVSNDAGIVTLAVSRQAVELRASTAHRIESGQWCRLDPASGLAEAGLRPPDLAGVWQNGLIVAEAEPLEALVARLARWMPGQVVVAGSDLARARVSGLFDITDPERALAAAVRPTGARIRKVSGLLTVISAV